MKKLISPLLMFAACICNAQTDAPITPKKATGRSEISAIYNFGFSNNLLKIPGNGNFTWLDHTLAKSYHDKGVTLRYSYAVLDKGNNRMLVSTGAGISNSQHYQIFIDRDYQYMMDKVVFDSKTIHIPLQLSYERALIDNRLLAELGFSYNWHIPMKKEGHYEQDWQRNDFIDYKYQLDVKTPNYTTICFSFTPKFRLVDNLFLNASISYLRGKQISYNYTYTTVKEMTNLTTFTQYTLHSTYAGWMDDIEIKDNYLYLSAGLSYKF